MNCFRAGAHAFLSSASIPLPSNSLSVIFRSRRQYIWWNVRMYEWSAWNFASPTRFSSFIHRDENRPKYFRWCWWAAPRTSEHPNKSIESRTKMSKTTYRNTVTQSHDHNTRQTLKTIHTRCRYKKKSVENRNEEKCTQKKVKYNSTGSPCVVNDFVSTTEFYLQSLNWYRRTASQFSVHMKYSVDEFDYRINWYLFVNVCVCVSMVS